MRSSGCTIQQALTLEAAAAVKQAVSLARRRGHAQVTPLHVANAMLSSSSSAVHLRRACLESHTHPLQCRALELCFNVALNRLPASTSSSPMLSGPHYHHHPSISNALVAAFKRAQAHQRRGSIENQQQQQQTILAVKIEVEQLIVSILDDPSVSRVMKEAGFSSTLVKAKVEEAISMEIMSSSNTGDNHNNKDPNHDHDHDIKESCSSKDRFKSHAITIPAGSLGLSLFPESDSLPSKTANGSMSWLLIKDGSQEERDNAKLDDDNNKCNSEPTPSLPSWLQKYKDENKGLNNEITKEDSIPVKDLCNSWSFSERSLSFSVSPPSASHISYEREHGFNPQQTRHRAFEVEPKCFWISTNNPTSNGAFQTTLSMYVPSSTLELPNSNPNSTSSSDVMELDSWNLETLCNALENKVPWQKEIIRSVASTVLNCRSRKKSRKEEVDDDGKRNDHSKEETWFFFLGDDVRGKEKIAKELARLVFGSENKFISIGLSSFSSKEDSGNKRLRIEESFTFTDRLTEAISVDPHRVFFVEDIEQMDYVSQVGIKRAIERGKIRSSCNGKEVSLEDAIIILSCERFSSRSRACSPSTKNIVDHHRHHHDHHHGGTREENKVGCCSNESNGNSISPRSVSLDLNISISDDCAFDDQDHKDQSYVDEFGLVGYVDKCILFKL